MDQELSRLARAVHADPSDEGVARRYDQGLRRAGRDEEVLARFRFKFRCPVRYEDLRPTEDPLSRACARCQRQVRVVDTVADLASQVAQGRCVAFPRARLEGAITGLAAEPRLHTAHAPGGPCLVETDLPWVALERLDPALLALVPAALAHEYGAVPAERRGRTVRVAFAAAPTLGALEHLRVVVGGHLEAVRAEPAVLERALAAQYPSDAEFLVGDLSGEV